LPRHVGQNREIKLCEQTVEMLLPPDQIRKVKLSTFYIWTTIA
jgi:hypothetical protein